MQLFLYVRCRLWWLVTKSSLAVLSKLSFILLLIIIINEASESAVIIVNNVVIVNQVLYCQKWTKSAERIIHLLVSWMQSVVTNYAQNCPDSSGKLFWNHRTPHELDQAPCLYQFTSTLGQKCHKSWILVTFRPLDIQNRQDFKKEHMASAKTSIMRS